jgi:hypothetical protein
MIVKRSNKPKYYCSAKFISIKKIKYYIICDILIDKAI